MTRTTQTTHTTETLVLGAGYAGLTAAALLADAGRDVVVLEGHQTVGGCASFFRTGNYTFDVGATTFSGVQPDQPAGRVFAHLGLQPDLEKIDPGMIIRLPDGDVTRYADRQQWIAHAEDQFPSGDQRGFWERLYRLEAEVYKITQTAPYLPPSRAQDWLRMMNPANIPAALLMSGLFQSMDSLMQRYGVAENVRFKRFVNEQLLISTQSNAKQAPYLTGAMGLTYPSDTYYPVGGMVRPAILLLRSITNNGGEVRFRRSVVSITQEPSGWWLVECSNGERYKARNVVSSIPIWNMSTIVHGAPHAWYGKLSSRFSRSWSALTLYFVLNGVPDVASPYMQMHLDEAVPFVHSGSLFLSMSRPHDRSKAPEGETTVTVSTHALAADWMGLTESELNVQKRDTIDRLVAVIKRRLPECDGMDWHHVEGGVPQTWVRYTDRHNGFVGGIPHTIGRNLLSMPRNQTPYRGLYQIGDSAFPGQGTPAVMLGAWNTVDRILGGIPNRRFAP